MAVQEDEMKRDLVLEGARRDELDMLRRISDGYLVGSGDQLDTLQSKGWLDVFNGTALLTLSGRTLLETSAGR